MLNKQKVQNKTNYIKSHWNKITGKCQNKRLTSCKRYWNDINLRFNNFFSLFYLNITGLSILWWL